MEDIIQQIQQTSMVEWLGTATGLIGVSLSIREKVLAWPFFILCYGLYAYLSFGAGLYAAMVLNAVFIPISVYGWMNWVRGNQAARSDEARSGVAISAVKPKQTAVLVCILIVGTLVVGYGLSRFAGGAMHYVDSFATTLSFLAQWMLSRKLVENWLAWLLADLVFIFMWGAQGYWVAVGMFVVFTSMAVLGYLSWRKELRNAAG